MYIIPFSPVESKLVTIIAPILKANFFELIDLEYIPGQKRGILRLFIDTPGGITLDQCAQASRILAPELDQVEFLEKAYILEVSSPGVDRPLTRLEDFERFLGKGVKIQTRQKINEQKNFTGNLVQVTTEAIYVKNGETIHQIPISAIVKANLMYHFSTT